MSDLALEVDGVGWLRLLVGATVLLLPGLAATDRWLRGVPWRWAWAPVFSLTLLSVAAVLLDFAVSLPVTTKATGLLALVLAGALGWPRIRSIGVAAWRWTKVGSPPVWHAWRGWLERRVWPALRPALGLLLVMPLLVLVHSLPHLPGAAPAGTLDVARQLGERAVDLAAGRDVPYPVHVDEHYHLAQFGEIDRTGEVRINDPYTGEPDATPLFTVGGMRSERGWQIAMVQIHQLTGASFPTLTHALPALWAAYLGLTLWLLLQPAPGALASAALVAILPTTVRFLGVAFLVPSAFALPWILAVLAVAARGQGPGRLAALAVLITGGFFMHLVPGTLTLAAGLLTAVLRPATWTQRAGLLAAILLPLVWIYPAIAADAQAAVASEHTLPFEQKLFLRLGFLVLAGAVLGAARAWHRRDESTLPHRVLFVLCLAIMASLVTSIAEEHRNEATYSRIIPTFFLTIAALAGLGFGTLAQAVPRIPLPTKWRLSQGRMMLPRIGTGAMIVVLAASLVVPVGASLADPYYRVFDDRSWQAAQEFAATRAGPEDAFLSHPWHAPILSMATGARPYTVLLPGTPPDKGQDYTYYVESGGADAQWLAEREIDYVVAPVPPNAPHHVEGPDVYRVLRPQS